MASRFLRSLLVLLVAVVPFAAAADDPPAFGLNFNAGRAYYLHEGTWTPVSFPLTPEMEGAFEGYFGRADGNPFHALIFLASSPQSRAAFNGTLERGVEALYRSNDSHLAYSLVRRIGNEGWNHVSALRILGGIVAGPFDEEDRALAADLIRRRRPAEGKEFTPDDMIGVIDEGVFREPARVRQWLIRTAYGFGLYDGAWLKEIGASDREFSLEELTELAKLSFRFGASRLDRAIGFQIERELNSDQSGRRAAWFEADFAGVKRTKKGILRANLLLQLVGNLSHPEGPDLLTSAATFMELQPGAIQGWLVHPSWRSKNPPVREVAQLLASMNEPPVFKGAWQTVLKLNPDGPEVARRFRLVFQRAMASEFLTEPQKSDLLGFFFRESEKAGRMEVFDAVAYCAEQGPGEAYVGRLLADSHEGRAAFDRMFTNRQGELPPRSRYFAGRMFRLVTQMVPIDRNLIDRVRGNPWEEPSFQDRWVAARKIRKSFQGRKNGMWSPIHLLPEGLGEDPAGMKFQLETVLLAGFAFGVVSEEGVAAYRQGGLPLAELEKLAAFIGQLREIGGRGYEVSAELTSFHIQSLLGPKFSNVRPGTVTLPDAAALLRLLVVLDASDAASVLETGAAHDHALVRAASIWGLMRLSLREQVGRVLTETSDPKLFEVAWDEVIDAPADSIGMGDTVLESLLRNEALNEGQRSALLGRFLMRSAATDRTVILEDIREFLERNPGRTEWLSFLLAGSPDGMKSFVRMLLSGEVEAATGKKLAETIRWVAASDSERVPLDSVGFATDALEPLIRKGWLEAAEAFDALQVVLSFGGNAERGVTLFLEIPGRPRLPIRFPTDQPMMELARKGFRTFCSFHDGNPRPLMEPLLYFASLPNPEADLGQLLGDVERLLLDSGTAGELQARFLASFGEKLARTSTAMQFLAAIVREGAGEILRLDAAAIYRNSLPPPKDPQPNPKRLIRLTPSGVPFGDLVFAAYATKAIGQRTLLAFLRNGNLPTDQLEKVVRSAAAWKDEAMEDSVVRYVRGRLEAGGSKDAVGSLVYLDQADVSGIFRTLAGAAGFRRAWSVTLAADPDRFEERSGRLLRFLLESELSEGEKSVVLGGFLRTAAEGGRATPLTHLSEFYYQPAGERVARLFSLSPEAIAALGELVRMSAGAFPLGVRKTASLYVLRVLGSPSMGEGVLPAAMAEVSPLVEAGLLERETARVVVGDAAGRREAGLVRTVAESAKETGTPVRPAVHDAGVEEKVKTKAKKGGGRIK